MHSYQNIKDVTINNLIECTKDDKPEPLSLEYIIESAPLFFSSGCRSLGVEIHAEYGKIGQPQVPEEITNKLRGHLVSEPMLITHEGTQCLIVSLSIHPPIGFLEKSDAYDRLHEYKVRIGHTIPRDSRIMSITLVDASGIEGINEV